jgi:hypothetical protein
MLNSQAGTLQLVLSPAIKRGAVSVGTLLLMIYFAANGINILTDGKIGPTERTLLLSGNGLSRPSRLALAAIYIVVAAFITLLVWKWNIWRIW